MSYFQLKDFYDETGAVRITEQGYENLITLSEVVSNTHYSYVSATDKEDLRSVGVLKALGLLKNGDFDPARSSLKNYLYTGMRNEMKNYLYKNSKDVAVDDEIMMGINEDKSSTIESNMSITDISDELIMNTVGWLLKGDRTLDKVKASLKHIGFDVDYDGKGEMFKEVEKEVCLVIWKRLKN